MTPDALLGELAAALRALSVAELATAGSYLAVVAVVAADLISGRLSGRRVADRAQLRVAVTLAAGAVAAGAVYGAVVIAAYTRLVGLVPWHGWMAAHPVVAFTVAFVAVDAANWAHHWVSHRTRWGWFCHRPHHTGDTYDASLALRQSWLPLPSMLILPAVAATGAPLAAFGVVAACVATYSAATHIGAELHPPAWVTWLFVTPGTHRRHHSDGATNLGAVLTIWDRAAGTYRHAGASDAPVGVNDGRSLRGALAGTPGNAR